MPSVVAALLQTVLRSWRSRAALQAEILVLRHQLHVLQRSRPHRIRLTRADRALWVSLSRMWSGWRAASVLVKPATVVAWHRRGFRLFWRWKSRRRFGRPRVSAELRTLIQTMSNANPLWGAPRIHGELLKLGIDVSQATVAKYISHRRRPPSPSWRTFLANHASQIMGADFFVVPTVTYRLLFVFVILSHERRRLVHTAVTAHPSAAWTAQQLREAFPDEEAPRFLIHDRDTAFAAIRSTIDGMGIREIRTAARSPWQNGYAERVIGSIRRECLDHVIVLTESGLRRVLAQYKTYYQNSRTHLGLAKDTPISRPVSANGSIVAVQQVGGLHHRYDRRAA
jgi:putative transposase